MKVFHTRRPVFLALMALLVMAGAAWGQYTWLVPLQIEGNGAVVSNLHFGTAPTGTDGFDASLDDAPPPPPPGGDNFVFTITDSVTNSLSRDIRSDAADSLLYKLSMTFANEDTITSVAAIWDIANLPTDGSYYIVAHYGSTAPDLSSWTNMRAASRLAFEPGQKIKVYFSQWAVSGIANLTDTGDDSGVMITVNGRPHTATSIASGAWSIAHLGYGAYDFYARKAGYVGDTLLGEAVNSNRTGLNFTLTPTAVPETTWMLSGHAILSDRASGPHDGILVTLVGLGRTALTDAAGFYRFDSLLSGGYTLTFAKAGYITRTEPGAVSHGNITVNTTLDPVAPTTYTVIGEIHLADTTNWTGTQVFKNGTFLIATGPDGRFTDAGIPEGTFVRYRFDHAGWNSDSVAFTVNSDTTFVRTLARSTASRFTFNGTVTLTGATNYAGTVISVTPHDTSITTGATGMFRFNLVAGSYNLSISHSGYTPVNETIDISANLNRDFTLDPLAGPTGLIASRRYSDHVDLTWNAPPPPGERRELILDDGAVDSLPADTTGRMFSYLGTGSDNGVNANLFVPDEPVTLVGMKLMGSVAADSVIDVAVWAADTMPLRETLLQHAIIPIDSLGVWQTLYFDPVEMGSNSFGLGWIDHAGNESYCAIDTNGVAETLPDTVLFHTPSYIWFPSMETDYGITFFCNLGTVFGDPYCRVKYMIRAVVINSSGYVYEIGPAPRGGVSPRLNVGARRVDRRGFTIPPADAATFAGVVPHATHSSAFSRPAISVPIPTDLASVTALTAFNVYRSFDAFDNVADAELITSITDPAARSYTDNTGIEPGNTYYYRVTAVYDEGESAPSNLAEGATVIPPDPAQVLILDWDNARRTVRDTTMEPHEALQELLTNIDVSFYTSFPDEDDLIRFGDFSQYQAIMITTGIYPYTVMTDSMLVILSSYISNGGQVYFEGPEVGYAYGGSTDTIATDFFTLFGTEFSDPLQDGYFSDTGNVAGLSSANATFFGRIVHIGYEYQSPADNYLDELKLVRGRRGAQQALFSDPTTPPFRVDSTRVAYKDSTSTNVYRTVISSPYLGGMFETTPGFDPERILSSYMWFFGIENTGVDWMTIDRNPADFDLAPSFPNPADKSVAVRFTTPHEGNVTVDVVDVTGSLVCRVADRVFSPGHHLAAWTVDAPAGTYFFRVTTDGRTLTTPITVVK